MSRKPSKKRRLRLNADAYRQLHRQVLERDGWRCQGCGTMSNLEVHHKEFRSRFDQDSEENLITLCAACFHLRQEESTETHWRSAIKIRCAYSKDPPTFAL